MPYNFVKLLLYFFRAHGKSCAPNRPQYKASNSPLCTFRCDFFRDCSGNRTFFEM